MDWTAISDQLAKGQKLYEVFREGANLAAQLASLERARNELQAQYDALPGQITQAKADLQSLKDQAQAALANGARASADQVATLQAGQAKRVAEAQKELEVWGAKILAQSQAFDAEYSHYQDVIKGLKAQIDQLTGQIDALEQIKTNLKSQLQGIA